MAVRIRFLYLLFIILISFGAIGGCGNNGGEQDGTQALTENDFAEDPNVFANPASGVVVTFVEPPDSGKPDNDTGDIGVDIILYRYNEDLNHTYCFEDENVDAEHFAILFDSEGIEVLRVEANGECVTEFILAGDYFLEITHDGNIEETLPIFAIPGQNGEQAAQRVDTDQGLFKSAKSQFSRILNKFHNIITQKAKAQSVADNLRTLLSTNKCVGCDLTGANLFGANLTGANLTGANLTGANLNEANLSGANLIGADLVAADLVGANLSGANLSGANLSEANLVEANLNGADLNGADLSGANLIGANLFAADLVGANLSGANLNGADLSGANLSMAILNRADLFAANLTGANLSGANLTGAIWCDGNCICTDPSIGTCVGCAPVDEVCTGP